MISRFAALYRCVSPSGDLDVALSGKSAWCRACALVLMLHVAGCATAPEGRNLADLNSVREHSQSQPGPWSYADNALANVIPGQALSTAYLRGEEASAALIKGFAARNVELEALIEFAETGAPSLIFRVQLDGEVITAMYVLALYAHGVNLWRFNANGWTLIETHVFEVTPDTPHTLHVRALADRIAVAFDGKPLFEAYDTFLMLAGGAGVRATQGPCRFHALHASNLD